MKPQTELEVSNDNQAQDVSEDAVAPGFRDPNAEPGTFVTMAAFPDQDGTVTFGIQMIPIDKRIVKEFQQTMGEQMAKENIKWVIVGDKCFLAPVKTSSLILPTIH